MAHARRVQVESARRRFIRRLQYAAIKPFINGSTHAEWRYLNSDRRRRTNSERGKSNDFSVRVVSRSTMTTKSNHLSHSARQRRTLKRFRPMERRRITGAARHHRNSTPFPSGAAIQVRGYRKPRSLRPSPPPRLPRRRSSADRK